MTPELAHAVPLPSGRVLRNRLAKAPMEEMLGPLGGGDPTAAHCALYKAWAGGDWGMVITGNVMVSPLHQGTPWDVVLPDPVSSSYARSVDAFRAWASAAHGMSSSTQPAVIMQLCHPGRQSMRGSGRSWLQPSLAPSSVPLNAIGDSALGKAAARVIWGTPKEMDQQDIEEVVESFVRGAKLALSTGFDGIQLHCSHGYLLAQFLSPNINFRTDEYGGSRPRRTKLLFRIIDAVRNELPMSSGFCLGIKLNSADYVQGGMTEKDALENIQSIAEHGGIDFIDISGGTYENPMFGQEDRDSAPKSSASTLAREAFFLAFSTKARHLLHSLPPSRLPTPIPLIMLTGGFRTRDGMIHGLSTSSTDLIGIGRPACADPHLPLKLLDPALAPELARAPRYSIKGAEIMRRLPFALLLPGVSTVFHTLLLAQVSRGQAPDLEMNILTGLWRVWIWPVVRRHIYMVVLALSVAIAWLVW